MEQPAKKRPATPGSWRPGISGNPAGRKPNGETLADAYRAKFTPERIVELAERLATEAVSEQVRLQALAMISERAHGKVANVLDASINAGTSSTDYSHLSAMPLDERRLLLAKLRGEPAPSPVVADPRLPEPQATDDESP